MAKPVATIESVEDFLYDFAKVDKDDVITFRSIDFEIAKQTRSRPPVLELMFTHPGSKTALNSFKAGIWKEVRGTFQGTTPTKHKNFEALKLQDGILYLNPEEYEQQYLFYLNVKNLLDLMEKVILTIYHILQIFQKIGILQPNSKIMILHLKNLIVVEHIQPQQVK